MSVSHVSHRWRNITLNTPSLWTDIFVDAFEPGGLYFMRLCIERSSLCLLHITINAPFDGIDWELFEHHHLRVVAKVSPSADRWHSLTVKSTHFMAIYEAIKHMQYIDFPYLENLEVVCDDDFR
jgi:hypothetical protein